MTIEFEDPRGPDGYFSVFNAAHVFDGDRYYVRPRDGSGIQIAEAEVDEYAYFKDKFGEHFEDIEWVMPVGPDDRVSLRITATNSDLERLIGALQALASGNCETGSHE